MAVVRNRNMGLIPAFALVLTTAGMGANHPAASTTSVFPVRIDNGAIEMSVDADLGFRVYSPYAVKSGKGSIVSDQGYLSHITLAGSDSMVQFRVVQGSLERRVERNAYGRCGVVSMTACSSHAGLFAVLRFLLPANPGNTIICESRLENRAESPIEIDSYTPLGCLLDATWLGADSSYKFWSFQGGSYPGRYDWIFPLTRNYARDNYQGMNAPDYGGGMPLVDLWTNRMGIGFAAVSRTPELVSLPVKVLKAGGVSFSITYARRMALDPHRSTAVMTGAMVVHHGDFYEAVKTYSRLMDAFGVVSRVAPADAFLPEWCAWGYGREFTRDQILRTLPAARKLGFGWVTIDDGWQNNVGDWEPNRDRFPGGEPDFRAFIDSIHACGMRVRLWWCPLAAQDSGYSAGHYPSRMREFGMGIQSRIALAHPEWFIHDTSGGRIQVSWWNAYSLCPALPDVRRYHREFTRKAILRWKIDGFKIDGQNANMAAECFNGIHGHDRPSASCTAVPEAFKEIYTAAMKLNRNFVIQLCPCGTNFSAYNLPFVNQTVASDPLNSWQVRLKGKTFRAFYGSKAGSFSGDHVELTNHAWDETSGRFVLDGKPDFASTLAVGGVPASKFTISGGRQADSSLVLDPPGMRYYEQWMNVYAREDPGKGTYLNLYDIAYDKPETHVIRRGRTYYYSFFSDGHFDGDVELRGLAEGHYRASDVVTGRSLAPVGPDAPVIRIQFDRSMIVKVTRSEQ